MPALSRIEPVMIPVVTGVTIELAPLNNSGYVGVARIDAAPNGGSNVSVVLCDLTLPTAS